MAFKFEEVFFWGGGGGGEGGGVANFENYSSFNENRSASFGILAAGPV